MGSTPELVFNVHGGITYSGTCDWIVGDFEHAWWFGFDCSHAGDATLPGPYGANNFSGDIFRDVAYVKEECEKLADQLLFNHIHRKIQLQQKS